MSEWSQIELRDIRVFLTLAEELHFGRTAERLSISHSRVSQTIGSLEARLNGKLFDRTSRRVQLTPLGQQLRARIGPPYSELQRAYSDALDSAKGVTGMLRLGFCAHSRAGPHIFEIIKTFERRYSGCKVKVTEVDTDNDQIDRLNREELDVIVLRLPSDDPELVIGPVLLREPRVLLVNSDHLLAGRSSVVLEDLAGYVSAGEAGVPTELLDILSPPVTPSGRPIRRVILQSPHEVAMRTAAGELVHPTVPSFFETYRQQGLVAVPIDDLPDLTRALAWLRSNNALKIRAFVQIAGSVLEGSPSSEGLQG